MHASKHLRVLRRSAVALVFFGAGLVLASTAGASERKGGIAASYFPLDVGCRWIYRADFADQTLLARVTDRQGEVAVYEFGSLELRLRDRGAEIDIELPREGFVPHYRFEEDSWLHRDFFGCDDNRTLRVLRRDVTVSTAAGVFENCLEIAFSSPSVCSDAGTFVEWWAPGVGRVKWEESNIAGVVVWELQSFGMSGEPAVLIRGDCNGDGSPADVSDAVALLTANFHGRFDIPCRAACDADGDGDTGGTTDAIGYLTFSFLGGKPPVAPFPACGPAALGSDELLGCTTPPANCQ